MVLKILNYFVRHEKEGIPVELIQHLDVCVEVPQEGIIRSMNVHVTGASKYLLLPSLTISLHKLLQIFVFLSFSVFIWEYARQQMGLSHVR